VLLFLGFLNKCYAHGVICKLCGYFVNRWRTGGGRDHGPVTPWHRSSSIPLDLSVFVYVALDGRIFPCLFPCTLERWGPWDEFLRGGDASKTKRLVSSPYGPKLGESVSTLSV